MITKTSGNESTFRLHGTAPILTCLLLAVALTSQHQSATAAELPVALGSAANFGVLAGTTVTSTGATIVNGDLGLWPGTSVVGFPPGTVIGTMYVNDPLLIAKTAQGDLTTAYNDAAGRSTAPVTIAGNLAGQTLASGLYKSTSSLGISSGVLTLDGQGNPNAVFIFQIASDLTTSSGGSVTLIGGAQAANVFWQVGSSATIGTTSGMKGNILALQSISILTGATLQGRALARNAQVSLDGNGVSVPPTGGGGAFVASTNVFVIAASPITLNPQTGLFEQTVRLSNSSPNTVAAARLLIQALPADVQVYNAGGSISNTAFLQYNLALPPFGAAVDLHVEYYRASRLAIPQPGFVPQDTTPLVVTATGPVIEIDRKVQFENGRFLIEFTATQGRHYAVQYSSDMVSWKTANPIITAPANRVQWYDDGPPKTESKPTSVSSRFYRVILLP